MTITPTTLTRAAGVAAALSGTIFIGVQLGHPHLDAGSITTTEVAVRSSLKVLMAALGLVGVTGMYLRQVRQSGVLGLVGYLVLSTAYLLVTCSSYASAYVLPSLAGSNPGYVDDVVEVATGGAASGDIGLLEQAIMLQDLTFLAGGLLFGIAMYRARVLARWAAALLAVGGVVTVALAVMPDALYRLLAFPIGLAMVALGWSLFSTARTVGTSPAATAVSSPRTTADVG
jgi:hypothetical protein